MNIQHPAKLQLNEISILSSKDIDKFVDSHIELMFSNFSKTSKAGRKRILSFNQVLGFLNLKNQYSCNTWKGLHKCLLDRGFILPHYSNFLKTIKLTIKFLKLLIDYTTIINKHIFLKKQFKIALVDSTPIPVCHIKRSSRHKTMKEGACYSKSTMGWFYGFKLHLTCDNETRDVIDYEFSRGNLDDRKYLAKVLLDTKRFKDTGTMFITDKGYQAKWLQDLATKTGNLTHFN